ncbi:endonuclease [Clostridium botulinum]|uniref:Endonuclease/exonuclease/phosphatase family protein n=1 Tax=Clostridium botulinum D str. 1873 TaxID=592027 RepID=A0A9P2G829_CLOBO|nr:MULTISPECIES: endonuclease/exonuclease/phosphatase family protein [Clostridium]AYF53413.1 endonuclease [Clostridium novyi]EES91730.1 endonuclease/exonuclease/phosphatase family protein [Clostridium botulinum D str. 1873]MBO3442778.1 hypothetical protein [Clostridium haemolyticum]NFV47318.1 endonuclease [Clostridium botulinum]QPW55877.1 endonuclease [Clostridium botulinum]
MLKKKIIGFFASGLILINSMTVFAVSSSCKGLQNSGIVSEVKIRDIQGRAHRSPLEGKGVKGVKGVVTAISNDKYSRGFYMQDTNPDNDDSTSEGIFVEAKKDKLNVKEGDLVEVDGTVIEAKNEIKGMGGLTTTEIKAADIKTKSHNNKLPDPIIIGASGRRPSTTTIDSDGLKVFNPDKDAIDFYESLEGMLVKVDKPLVVGLDERYGEVYVLPDNGIASQNKKTIFNGINISKNNFNPEKLTIDDVLVPITDNHTKKFIDKRFDKLKTGDKFNDSITGVMTYAFGNYKILNTKRLPDFTDGGVRREITKIVPDKDKLSIASYNVENFSAVTDKTRIDKVAKSIVENLKSPDIVGLIEIQDNDGADSKNKKEAKSTEVKADKTYKALIDAINNNKGPQYDFVNIDPINRQDGGIPGGNIRVGYIYRKDRVNLVSKPKGDAKTEVHMDGKDLAINPGRIGVDKEEFKGTRKSLAAEFEFKGEKVFVIANHFSSKRGDQSLFGAKQPPVAGSERLRMKQASIVNKFAEEILKANPNGNVVLLGDMNDFNFSNTVTALKGKSFENMVDKLPAEERFTYIHQGNSQVLDNILVNKNIVLKTKVDAVNINSAFTDAQGRCSDHDPVLIQIDFRK